MNNEKLAKELCGAIKEMARKPENLDNFECYLSHHFDVWMEEYANTPKSLVSEMKSFAEMEI